MPVPAPTNDFTQDRTLAFDSALQPLHVPCVGVAARFAPQRLAFLGIGLFQLNAYRFGCTDHFMVDTFQQAAVYRIGDGFLLHGGIY